MTDIVPKSWLTDRSDDVRIVDVRDSWEYDGIGHLPGAVNIPFDAFRAEESGAADDGMLPGEDVFADLLSEAGIDSDDDIVAYDDTHGVFAARFLVTAELYGHDPANLHLLDGDFSAWQLQYETSGEAPQLTPTEYVVDLPAETPLVDADAVSGAVDSDAVIVDTREQWEYDEGHIPGAVRLDWRELVDDDTRGLLPEDEARDLLESRGITPDAHIVLYCNTARRISHTYVVLQHLGYEKLAFYEGSLTDWEAQGRPLDNEDE
jgi:thiosulfate/3-mercaptopyruvate sulfurtransferase